jgi:hypothetical protein
MSDIAPLYLPCRAGIGHLSMRASRPRREAMISYQAPIATPVRSARKGSRGVARPKAIALETIQTLSGNRRAPF